MKKAVRSLTRRLNRGLYLWRQNSLVTVFRFELHDFLKQKRTISVKVNGVDLTLRTCSPDLATARSCLEDGEFDALPNLLKHLRFGFIIDAGGYIGTAAIALAKMFPSALIVSIEPSQDNFKLLEQNVKPFKNVIAVNKALLDSVRNIHLRNRGTGEWGYTVIQEPADCNNGAALHSVAGTTVETLLLEHSKDGIDILKLDIEGGERDVLRASGSWMPRTAIVVAELHDRIADGCTHSFYSATAGLEHGKIKSGKVIAVNRIFCAEPRVCRSA
jgi:FkbM family methyltransferase